MIWRSSKYLFRTLSNLFVFVKCISNLLAIHNILTPRHRPFGRGGLLGILFLEYLIINYKIGKKKI